MNNMENEKVEYWIIKLGKLFYTGGLPRLLEEHEDVKGYDFSNKEDTAFPILIEDLAKELAILIGGIAIKKEEIVKNIMALGEKNKAYSCSCEVWKSKQFEEVRKSIDEM